MIQAPNDQLQWPTTANSRVRIAGLFPLDVKGFRYGYRSAVHAIHLHEYAGTIRLADREYPLEPGTLTVSPANEDSSYDLPRPGVHWCIHFDPQPVGRNEPQLSLPLVLHLGSEYGEAVRRFSHITRLYVLANNSGDDEALAIRLATSVALQELLVWAALFQQMNSHRSERPTDRGIERLFDFIDRNLGRKLTADELATQAQLSQNHLAKRFRQRTGTTLPSYVLSRRVGLARLLLETTNLPIKQIAMRVGMPDAHHFNKQFRAIAGVSPTDFRRGEEIEPQRR